jgi:two-component system NtrC family response regulator
MRNSRAESALRLLLVGVSDELQSKIAFQSLSDAKVELVPTPVFADAEAREWVASFDAFLLDASGIPSDARQEIVRRNLGFLLNRDPCLKAIVLVPQDDSASAQIAVESGAWDVVTADEGPDGIGQRLRAAARLRRLQAQTPVTAVPEDSSDQGAVAEAEPVPNQMVGTSSEMRQVFSLIRRVAATDVPVLLIGESGTGKELAALAVHERSLRAAGPFVPIHCAAIPETLLESELFGHERGAFTGATTARRGRLEAAHEGTLFLDEIGELALALQVKLLRFLEDHVVERVGGRKRIQLDVRVIAATNRDLSDAVKNGGFREDLFYRLAVFAIHMPALRERGEDPILMAKFFLDRYAEQESKAIRGFSRDAVDAVSGAHWPGNVRELINRVRRAVVVADGPLVTAEDLGFEGDALQEPVVTLRAARHRAEIECLRAALRRTGWNKSEAARALDISRTQLYELMHRHQIPDQEPQ